MKEITVYARAGQGAITTAVILGNAYFKHNKFAYAFPHFGAARMGAPMNAFIRVDDKPIRVRS
ncbi:MAG: 2-oxoacid:acceptor oxidoreductase family protein, partial [Candidatus Omnitrophica bacterium]|nr:2-oxoacid:acceptor oxidoreductase family protein [Candidatus Omnitrophota bacterium]